MCRTCDKWLPAGPRKRAVKGVCPALWDAPAHPKDSCLIVLERISSRDVFDHGQAHPKKEVEK